MSMRLRRCDPIELGARHEPVLEDSAAKDRRRDASTLGLADYGMLQPFYYLPGENSLVPGR
jgi:hypothetical protein